MQKGQPAVDARLSRTADIMAGAAVRGGKNLVTYPRLRDWPVLAPAVAVHVNVDKPGRQLGFRIPVKLMRKCGMHPELGVNVAVLNDRVVIWGDERGGMYRQDQESKQFTLTRTGVGPRLTQANYAIVEGPDYLIVTTRKIAMATAGGVPVYCPSWDRLTEQSLARVDGDLDLASLRVLSWQDVSLFHPNVRSKSGVASVAGRQWCRAGLFTGDPVRFTRYNNATVVERCDPSEKHSILSGTAAGYPRHFVGATLFDTHLTDRIRVIATPNRLIFTMPDSELGKLCEKSKQNNAAYASKQTCSVLPPVASKCKLPMHNLHVLAIKDYHTPESRLNIYGRIWTAAGFERNQPARFVEYADALVIEPCSVTNMDFRLGSPSQELPYRDISLRNTVLSRAGRVRVLVAEGRLILTTRNSDVGRRFRAVTQWPSNSIEVADFLARLGRAAKLPAPEPAVELSKYQVPAGRRLQIQGKWLQQLGFKPGAKFEVATEKGQVRLRLVSNGGATVTEHSPGTSKLYVPAQTLGQLKTDQVRVLGRAGELQLVPLAA
ncbi:hypothetical protein KTD31_00645 [Burkholderia multivorans]|uniref:hypothetical protein n=1 Tax=Burkholderia multivorans TaxID=87883 RepID=UPI001C23D5D0|nr:hypothetical protein [Burkholderia multivorans]MBU9199908.1 hypothetical protein [Burkholderia multivorans]MDN8078973.1 hypothetical protein [Burkholderia multivorans]